mgnify:CR=1 FL=1
MLEKRNKSLKGQIHQLRYDERDEGEYLDMDTIIAKWFSTSEQKITWSISLAFFLIFPLYFWQFSFFLPDDATISGGAGVSGEWDVSFDETDVATSEESQFLMDGEEYVFEFQFDDTTPNLGYVEITVSHGETDESGQWPDQCDNAVGEMRMGQVNEFVRSDSTTTGDSGSANDCPASYTMVIMLIENYTGDSYQTTGSKGEIENMWNDNGNGRGEYRCQITLETRTGSKPGPVDPFVLGNNEDGEEITVSWRVVGVEVSVAPVVVIDA